MSVKDADSTYVVVVAVFIQSTITRNSLSTKVCAVYNIYIRSRNHQKQLLRDANDCKGIGRSIMLICRHKLLKNSQKHNNKTKDYLFKVKVV